MQMIFITQIRNHESIESIELGSVCLKDWDKLMTEFEGSSNILVADVDCIGSGKSKSLGAKNGKMCMFLRDGSGVDVQSYVVLSQKPK